MQLSEGRAFLTAEMTMTEALKHMCSCVTGGRAR